MSDDYYAILELPRNAPEADIKKAYRRMALRWHPDKNQDNKDEADRRFKEISEAYEVLSDPSKRQVYDIYGKAGLENAGASAASGSSRYSYGGGGFADFHHPHAGYGGFHSFVFRDPQEVFREFFGGRDPFADFLFIDPFETFRQQQQQQQHQHQHQLFQNSFVGFPAFQLHDPSFFSFGHFGGAAVPAAGGSQFLSFSSSSFGPSTQFHSSSTSTRVVDGRQIVTKKVVQNGVETVTVTENGKVIQRTVNGRQQPIEGGAAAAAAVASAPVAGLHASVAGGGRSQKSAHHTGGASSSRNSSSGSTGSKRNSHNAASDQQKKQKR